MPQISITVSSETITLMEAYRDAYCPGASRSTVAEALIKLGLGRFTSGDNQATPTPATRTEPRPIDAPAAAPADRKIPAR
jgi:hypothetical protein